MLRFAAFENASVRRACCSSGLAVLRPGLYCAGWLWRRGRRFAKEGHDEVGGLVEEFGFGRGIYKGSLRTGRRVPQEK
jgi:hypothetical protein